MKIRTWEKVYWGIITGLIVISLIGILLNKGDIEFIVNNEISYISKGKATLYCILFYGGIGLIFWLIIKLFTGGFKE